jgi:hypothetical protein
MPLSLRRIFSLLCLVAYVASLMVVVLPHGDVRSAFGSGKAAVAAHGDAENCKHLDASHAETCSLCSFAAGNSSIAASPFVLETSVTETEIVPPSFVQPQSFLFLTSFSLRAPPSLLTFA